MKPIEIRRQEKGLAIFWDNDSETFSDFGVLRKSCTCAICKESKTPLNEGLPFYQKSISLQSMQLVGNYAVEILWGDGHRSIISFDRLKAHEA